MDMLTSLQNKRVRYVKSLQTKARFRRGERKLALEGDRLIGDALRAGGKAELAFYSPEKADYALIARLQNRRCALQPVSEQILQHLSDTQHAPGILAVFQLPRPGLPPSAESALILDSIREPGNLGAIARTAAAAGVELMILAPGCADPYNPKAMRAGMGAHFRLPLVEASWKEIAGYCGGMRVCVARAEEGIAYHEADWSAGWALILGNEARGAGTQANKLAESAISIPMSGAAESLNVAGAAAVLLFEARRQRRA